MSVGVVACVLSAATAGAATWVPELRLDTRYDDNVLHQPQGSDDYVTSITPGLLVFHRGPITSYELSGRTGFTSYPQTGVSTSRYDAAAFALEHRPGEIERFEVRGRYIQSVDPIDFDQGIVTTRGDVTNAQVRARGELFRAGGNFQYRRWDYAVADLADGSAIDMTGRLYPFRNDVTTASVDFRYRVLETENVEALEADYQMVSLKRRHSASFSSQISGGRVRAWYSDGFEEVRGAFALELERTGYDPEAPVILRLRVADDIATTVEASLDVQRDGRAATLSWDTLLEADGGLYRVPTLTRRGSIIARDTLYGGQVLELGGSFGRTRRLRGSGPEVEQWRATAGISQPIGTWLTGRIGWDYMRQDAPVAGTVAEFDRNRYTLTLIARPGIR